MSDKVVRTFTGTVVSDTSDKTVRVKVERRTMHPLYGKVMRKHTHLLAHDEGNQYKVGDTVRIQECPRHSKNKSWKVVGVASETKR